jgi:hypothetical protein
VRAARKRRVADTGWLLVRPGLQIARLEANLHPASAERKDGNARRSPATSCGYPFDQDRRCVGGDVPYAVFKAKQDARVGYRVCVERPVGPRKCERERTGARGEKSVTPIKVNALEVYRAKFKVRGRVVAHGKMA